MINIHLSSCTKLSLLSILKNKYINKSQVVSNFSELIMLMDKYPALLLVVLVLLLLVVYLAVVIAVI